MLTATVPLKGDWWVYAIDLHRNLLLVKDQLSGRVGRVEATPAEMAEARIGNLLHHSWKDASRVKN